MTVNTIMIVDDSPEDRLILETLLNDAYELILCKNSEEAFESLNTHPKPDIILLDVEMPKTDGYETCKMIRDNNKFDDIDIIFLSGHNSTDEIIRGYDAGAIDYVTKPFDTDVLDSKLKRTLQLRSNRVELKQQASAANQLVQTVMTESGSLGNIVNFLRASFTVNTATDLLNLLLGTIENYGLSAVAYASADSMEESASTNGPVSELEAELLKRFQNYHQPFFEKDARLFAIQKNIVLFVKNMPVELDKRGSIKDNLMILLEGANAKLEYFDQRNARSHKRAANVRDAMMKALSELDDIQALEKEHKRENMNIFERMVNTVEESVFSMGLTEEQEAELIGILQQAIGESENHMNQGLELDERVKKTVVELTHAAKHATE